MAPDLLGLPGIFWGLTSLATGGYTGSRSWQGRGARSGVCPAPPDFSHLSSPRSSRSLSRDVFPDPPVWTHDSPHILLPASCPLLSLSCPPVLFFSIALSAVEILYVFSTYLFISRLPNIRTLALMSSRGFCLFTFICSIWNCACHQSALQ